MQIEGGEESGGAPLVAQSAGPAVSGEQVWRQRADALERRVRELEEALSKATEEARALLEASRESERTSKIELELVRAGAIDPATAAVFVRDTLARQPEGEGRDVAEVIAELRRRAPYMFREVRAEMPTSAAGVVEPPVIEDDGLAERARRTGSGKDVLAYMRARRG
ncbi:MAG: hypothetical protein SFY95_02390 [Planctomycetota bacterium]|nr:hypothetical protein [Planctomycetota bacterium]